mmetsp:Transcript_49645/g.91654  ORF Transcript_49645/g.91654 Transcript_49645/m.91654 type:complete len:334 (+) Transcript_49645:87-1088(+)
MVVNGRALHLALISLISSGACSVAPDRAGSLLSIASTVSKAQLSDSVGDVATDVPQDVLKRLCPFTQQLQELRNNAQRLLNSSLLEMDVLNRGNATGQMKTRSHRLHPHLSPDAGRVAERIRDAKHCSVVSNSGVLLDHKHGRAIDEKSDLVFRFNDAQIGGDLLEIVGSRDDVRILNFKLSGFGRRDQKYDHYNSPNSTTQFPVFLPKRAEALRDPAKLAEKLMEATFGHLQGPGKAHTTGLEGVLLAMLLCDQVWAYGFPVTQNSAKAPFHYFGDMRHGSANENPEHMHAKVAALEKSLYNMLAMNSDVNASDVAVIPGFNALRCEQANLV